MSTAKRRSLRDQLSRDFERVMVQGPELRRKLAGADSFRKPANLSKDELRRFVRAQEILSFARNSDGSKVIREYQGAPITIELMHEWIAAHRAGRSVPAFARQSIEFLAHLERRSELEQTKGDLQLALAEPANRSRRAAAAPRPKRLKFTNEKIRVAWEQASTRTPHLRISATLKKLQLGGKAIERQSLVTRLQKLGLYTPKKK